MKPSEAALGEAKAERLVMPDKADRRTDNQSPSRSSIRDETRTSTLALNTVLSDNRRETATSPNQEPDDIQGDEGEENSRGILVSAGQEDFSIDPDPFAQQQRNVASATLVARGALKSGYLWKMGSNVPRWKRRYFVLKPITMLFYYMSEHDTEPRGCIDLDLFDAVRRVGLAQGGSSSTPNRTAFELYRSGFPGGSGFMLEARGQEDWEEWVEMIANCRHDKIQAETDVLKGTNKLLLEEIRGLERQVATFRGYADQRHVTVLALRDERHRSRELSLELAALGDMASALSGYIGEVKSRYFPWEDATNCAANTGSRGKTDWVESPATSSPDALPTACVTRAATVRPNGATAEQATTFPGEPNTRPSALPPSEAPETSTVTTADSELNSDEPTRERERRSLEAMRRALAEARREIDFMGMKLLEAHEAQKLAEIKLGAVQNAARVAEQRSAVAEEAASKARGRTEVLERNVEYLQWQQDGLRAQLCRAKKHTQVIRAQKGLLKKEVRELWARKDVPEMPAKNASAAETVTGVRRSRSRAGVVTPLPESRSWRSMIDLAKAGDAETGTPSESLGQPNTCTAVASSMREGGDLEVPRDGGGAIAEAVVGDLRSSVSGVSLGASDGGDTDMAEQSASEASDEESDKGQGARPRVGSSREGDVVIDRIRRRIRQQVGEARISPLPPPRQHRILEAVRKMSSPVTDYAFAPSVAAVSAVNAGGPIQGMVASRSSPSLMLGGNGNATGAAGNGPGLGVAGMILSGLGKGMVEKAAQARRGLSERRGSSSAGNAGAGVSLGLRSAASTSSLAAVASGASAMTLRGAEVSGGAALTNTMSRTPLIQLDDLESGGLCESPQAQVHSTRPACLATTSQPEELPASRQSGNGNRVSLPPRPEDEYELVFTSRVIGLQFCATPGNQSVVVQGRKGYMGAAPSGVPGERSSPDIGDVLESYNGVPARGKSVEVVGREIAACGRPLRLGFRSTRTRTRPPAIAGMVAAAAFAESEGESEGDDWAFRDTPDSSVEKAELKVSGDGGVVIPPVNSCGVAQGVVDASMRMHSGEGAWRELMSVTPAWARS